MHDDFNEEQDDQDQIPATKPSYYNNKQSSTKKIAVCQLHGGSIEKLSNIHKLT